MSKIIMKISYGNRVFPEFNKSIPFNFLYDCIGNDIKKLDDLVNDIVLKGITTSCSKYNLPFARFGKYVTMDSDEIDKLRLLKSVIKEYFRRNIERKKEIPLSLATFGQPGDGKSFSIKEIAKEFGVKNDDILTFNLSQWPEEPKYLAKAFNLIRDRRLLGYIPLVIWDEFDTNSYSWLRYFLSPMQDGTFDDDYLGSSNRQIRIIFFQVVSIKI